MISKWETERERFLKFMKIPAKKKLEWLYQMNEFIHKASSKRQRKIRRKLREVS
jgi:hypothetical protein